MHTLNGIGTTIYGKRRLTKKELNNMSIDVEGGISYVTTMWFVFLFVPLIPLGSYIVFAEFEESGFWNNSKQYHMVKINLNWNQVLKGWAITAGLIFILWLLLW